MNKLNCLIIEGEVIESIESSITLAYERKPPRCNFCLSLPSSM